MKYDILYEGGASFAGFCFGFIIFVLEKEYGLIVVFRDFVMF